MLYNDTYYPPHVKVLVHWATGKMLTNRLPKLGLITLSPPGTAGYSGPDRIYIYGSTCHQLAVPFSGDLGRVLFRFGVEKLNLFTFFLKKGLFSRMVRFELATQNPCAAVVAIYEGNK